MCRGDEQAACDSAARFPFAVGPLGGQGYPRPAQCHQLIWWHRAGRGDHRESLVVIDGALNNHPGLSVGPGLVTQAACGCLRLTTEMSKQFSVKDKDDGRCKERAPLGGTN
jgi:hypothetical protein